MEVRRRLESQGFSVRVMHFGQSYRTRGVVVFWRPEDFPEVPREEEYSPCRGCQPETRPRIPDSGFRPEFHGTVRADSIYDIVRLVPGGDWEVEECTSRFIRTCSELPGRPQERNARVIYWAGASFGHLVGGFLIRRNCEERRR